MLKLILIAVLVVGVYAGIQPYRTIQNLTQALENEDAARVDEYVDFDSVRDGFNDDFAKRLGVDPGRESSMGQILATTIASTFLSGIASPETMVAILKDKDRRDRMGLSSSLGDLVSRGSWVSDHEFVLKNDDGQPTTLVTRKGLTWEVTALRVY